MTWDCDNPQCNRTRISDNESYCTRCGRPRSLPPETEVARIMRMAREKRASQPKINVGGQPVNYAKRWWVCETCGTTNPGSSVVCKNYNNPKYHPEASKLRAAGRSIAGAGGRAGSAVAGAAKSAGGAGKSALRAVADIATNWSSTIRENVRAKTVESIILVIAAVVLVSFGFIWAAIGVLFFMFYLYLPNEEEVMARARQQASGISAAAEKTKDKFIERIEEIGAELTEAMDLLNVARDANDAQSMMIQIERKKSLVKALVKIEKDANGTNLNPAEKKEISDKITAFITAAGGKR